MQLGIFGGSFDPVHVGHLRLAEAARDQARLDSVLLVPASNQPLKPDGPVASGRDRLEMLRRAIRGRPGLDVSSIEVDRGGISYTAETLRQIAAENPQARLYFVIGADAMNDLPHWRQPEAILALATLLAVARPGHSLPELGTLRKLAPRGAADEQLVQRIEMMPDSTSSSEIRRRIAAGLPWQGLTVPSVAEYIETKGLYAAER